MAAVKKRKMVEACLAFVWTEGARPPVWRERIVRNNRTGQLAKVVLNELPPIDEGDPGVTHVVSKGERFDADDHVVVIKPAYFREVAE